MIIELQNVKGISHLRFEIPNTGLWLLTGVNGSGKTSLLAALYRIGNGRAFQDHFKTTAGQDRLDTFKDSAVTYHLNGEKVTYRYGGSRWRPKPSTNSVLLNDFPYESVVFVGADASRVEPFADEITPRYTRPVDDEVKSFLYNVLQHDKWNNLVYVNTRRGRGSEAYLVPYRSGRANHYYSEKNFSLGELCVLKLAKQLHDIAEGSLVLIDEIEMALHPQAQVRLLSKLKDIADEKQLTVIFSTHSSTLIKHVRRQNIIFLYENDQGSVDTKTNAYPAEVLGELAFDEEMNNDFIFFVEDEEAKLLLEQLCDIYTEERPGIRPAYSIVPIGGYVQVMEMLERASQIIPPHVKRYAFLDADVLEEALPEARRTGNQAVLDLYSRVRRNVSSLPCTPEVGVVEMFQRFSDDNQHRDLQFVFSGNRTRLDQHVTSPEYVNIHADNPRKVAKNKLNSVVNYATQNSGADPSSIRRKIYRKYCDELYVNGRGPLLGLLGPMFNT